MNINTKVAVYSILFFIVAAPVFGQDTNVVPNDQLNSNATTVERLFVLQNNEPLPEFRPYSSLNFHQTVERISDSEYKFQIRVDGRRFVPEDLYPISSNTIPENFDRYLQESRYIESNHPEIAEIAQRLLDESQPERAIDLVHHVLRWNRNHLVWGNPDDLPSAIVAFNTQVVNCIGFTHLPAAILRHLGIPARNIRTFIARPDQNRVIPHYMLEVYFPSLGGWVTYEPQRPGTPYVENLVLYTHHDWDFEGQQTYRPLAVNRNLQVLGGIEPAAGDVDIYPPELVNFSLEKEIYDPAAGDDAITFFVEAKDEGSGIKTIDLEINVPNGPTSVASMNNNQLESGTLHDGVWYGRLRLNTERNNRHTTWGIEKIRITDKSGNIREWQGWQLREMNLPYHIQMATWSQVDSIRPELVYMSPFYPSTIDLNAYQYNTFQYTIAKSESQSSGLLRIQKRFIEQGSSDNRTINCPSESFGFNDVYTISIQQCRINNVQYAPGEYNLSMLDIRDNADNILYLRNEAISQNGIELSLNITGEPNILASDTVIPETQTTGRKPEITRIIQIPDGEPFGGRRYLLVEVDGDIRPPARLTGDPRQDWSAENRDDAVTVFFTEAQNSRTERRALGNRNGDTFFLVRVNPFPGAGSTIIDRIELIDISGNTHKYYRDDFLDLMEGPLPEGFLK